MKREWKKGGERNGERERERGKGKDTKWQVNRMERLLI
jgi:hypothetical protein